MSKTPRTDAAKHSSCESVWSSWVEAEFADKLEMEIGQLAKQCVKNVEEIGDLRAVIYALHRDSTKDAKDVARLEFILGRSHSSFHSLGTHYEINRESIDEAMWERQKS
jgi:hypothetical protein